MKVLKRFPTHVGLIITLEADGDHQAVFITGAARKPLYEGEDAAKAKETYDYAVEHYVQRKIASEFGEEHEVHFFRKVE